MKGFPSFHVCFASQIWTKEPLQQHKAHMCDYYSLAYMYKFLYIYVFYQCARDQIKFYVNSVNKDSFVVYKPAG